MRVRNQVFAFVLAGSAAMAPAMPALAQGSAHPAPRAPAIAVARTPAASIAPPLTVAVPGAAAPVLPGVERAVAPPVLGQAWACAVRTVLDDMKHLVDAHKLAAQPLRPEVPPPPPTPQAPSIPTSRARWTLTGAMRDAIAASPVEVGPVARVLPPVVSVDTHGEDGVILGARVHLPWMVP